MSREATCALGETSFGSEKRLSERRSVPRRDVAGRLSAHLHAPRHGANGEASSSDEAVDLVAGRLAELGEHVGATVFELAEHPSLGGDRAAVRVLECWDEPEPVATLMRIAEDPARTRELRDEALVALCRLEAPEERHARAAIANIHGPFVGA